MVVLGGSNGCHPERVEGSRAGSRRCAARVRPRCLDCARQDRRKNSLKHLSRQGRGERKAAFAMPDTSWRIWCSLREEFFGSDVRSCRLTAPAYNEPKQPGGLGETALPSDLLRAWRFGRENLEPRFAAGGEAGAANSGGRMWAGVASPAGSRRPCKGGLQRIRADGLLECLFDHVFGGFAEDFGAAADGVGLGADGGGGRHRAGRLVGPQQFQDPIDVLF